MTIVFRCYKCKNPQELKADDFGLEIPKGYVMTSTKNGRVILTYLLCPVCAAKRAARKDAQRVA